MNLIISFTLLASLFLFTGFGLAAPTELQARDSCTPTYNRGKNYIFNWEDLTGPCFYGPCDLPTSTNLTSPRGAGRAYYNYAVNITRPWLFPNEAEWQAINCTSPAFVGKDEARACGSSGVKAIYSPGKSPWDSKIKPYLGTKDFPGVFAVFGIDSLWITPMRLPGNVTTAKFEITGYKVDGKKVSFVKVFDPRREKRFQLTGLIGRRFVELKALEFWITVRNTGGYPFAIDDLALTEYLSKPLPESCHPPTITTPPMGPCTPSATATTTWKYDAEEFTTQQAVPTPYKGVYWPSYVEVVNKTTNTYVYPPVVRPYSGKNIYKTYGTLGIFAQTYETRFGVDSIAVACGFYQYADPDYGLTNGRPCVVSFVGRRDRYDGRGLPWMVVANVTIPNPGNATSQTMTKVDLNKITTSQGAFRDLYSLIVFARVGDYGYETTLFVDDVVLTRELGAKYCRLPGSKTLNFDDIKVPGTTAVQLPLPYKGFKFEPVWAAAKKTNYPKTSPGYIAAVSGDNSVWSGFTPPPDVFAGPGIDSYVNPVSQFLWDFEEAVITLDVPDPATFFWAGVRVTVSVTNACGGDAEVSFTNDRQPWFYYRNIVQEGTKFQVKFAEPLRAISRFYITAYQDGGDYQQIPVFIDDLKYRVYDGPTPGCQQCGRRGGSWCEIPRIFR